MSDNVVTLPVVRVERISDLEASFTEACDEAGCAYDNEALLQAIHKLKQENSLLKSQFRNCHIEIAKLRKALLVAGVARS